MRNSRRKRLIKHNDDNYEKNGCLRDIIYGKNSKKIKGKFKAN